jgi:ribosome-associated heat shock protein Hsp15
MKNNRTTAKKRATPYYAGGHALFLSEEIWPHFRVPADVPFASTMLWPDLASPALCRSKKPAVIPLKISASYENGIMTRVRMDKWLWAARFFKTRALCARACELGRIASNGQAAKASREVRVGDLLEVKTEGGLFQVEVLLLSEMRGPAVVAQTLYRETEASRELRLKLAEERKVSPHFEVLREGKPSKRDRRQLGRLRGRV